MLPKLPGNPRQTPARRHFFDLWEHTTKTELAAGEGASFTPPRPLTPTTLSSPAHAARHEGNLLVLCASKPSFKQNKWRHMVNAFAETSVVANGPFDKTVFLTLDANLHVGEMTSPDQVFIRDNVLAMTRSTRERLNSMVPFSVVVFEYCPVGERDETRGLLKEGEVPERFTITPLAIAQLISQYGQETTRLIVPDATQNRFSLYFMPTEGAANCQTYTYNHSGHQACMLQPVPPPPSS